MRTPLSHRARLAAALLAALVALAGLLPAAPPAAAAVAEPAPGQTYVLRLKYTGHALEARAGERVVAAHETDEAPQHWRVVDTKAGDGYYQIINALSGKCLEIPGASKDEGVAVAQYRCNPNYHNQPNQLWKFEPQKDAGHNVISAGIRNKNSGKLLEYRDGDGGAVVQVGELTTWKGSAWEGVPIAPASSSAWVDLCKHADFVDCQRFHGARALANLGAHWIGNDQVTSVRTSGATVVLYEHDDYRGTCQAVGGEVRNLGDSLIGNDRATSAKLDRGGCFHDATAWLAPVASRSRPPAPSARPTPAPPGAPSACRASPTRSSPTPAIPW